MSRHSRSFAPDAANVGAARRFVRDITRDDQDLDADTLVLLVSELASNAVLHARSPFRVTVDQDRSRVRVEVADASPDLPAVHRRDPLSSTGRGMRLVADHADRWGTEPTDPGKVVWFELRRSSARAQEPSR